MTISPRRAELTVASYRRIHLSLMNICIIFSPSVIYLSDRFIFTFHDSGFCGNFENWLNGQLAINSRNLLNNYRYMVYRESLSSLGASTFALILCTHPASINDWHLVSVSKRKFQTQLFSLRASGDAYRKKSQNFLRR